MTPVTCSVCKAPFAVYGVEPPLEYVCAGCVSSHYAEMESSQTCDFCGARVLGDGDVLGDGQLMCYRCMHPSARPPGPSLFAITTEQWRKQARPQG